MKNKELALTRERLKTVIVALQLVLGEEPDEMLARAPFEDALRWAKLKQGSREKEWGEKLEEVHAVRADQLKRAEQAKKQSG